MLDRQTRAAVESARPIQLAVASTIRLWKNVWRGQLLGSAVRVSDRQFPRIQGIVKDCAEQLGINVPQVYIVNSPQMNAGTFGTDEESFILVHSALVDHYSDEELRTVIGHECGHIHNSHVVYLTTLHYLTRVASAFLPWIVYPAMIPLNELSRRAEITCDRAGMLCSKNEQVAARALTKLVLGSRKLYDEFNLDAFLEQYEEGKDSLGRYMEAVATHPFLPKRVLAMRVFAQSQLFKKTALITPSSGLTMNEVDDRVKGADEGRGVKCWKDSGERKLDVTVALQELGEIATSLGAKSLKDRLDKDLIKKLEEDRFHLVVVGEFNHGKSSFVNALLGETVLPVGVTPTTAAIHQLKYSETPESTVVYQSGKR